MSDLKRSKDKGNSVLYTEESLGQTIDTQDELSRDFASMLKGNSSGKSPLKKPPLKKPSASQGKNPPRKPPSPSKPKPAPDRSAPNIDNDKDKKEFFETPDELSKKLDTLANWVKDSKHCIIFTGAGISTSTGIPDFRSGMNTVLKTGPGKWELQAKGVAPSKSSRKVSYLKAVPSTAHMAIVKLQQEGLVKCIVSQNTDGLHLRSGINPENLAELHGNTNLEKCSRCKAKYLRDFRTRTAKKVRDHRTGRKCDNLKCGGELRDSIINFGEDLPEKEINRGFEEADKSDLCIVLGSSLRVTPAADIPEIVAVKGKKLVICNLQKTPLNPICSLEIHAQIDDVMVGLMERLGLEIPPFTINRRLAVEVSAGKISFQGLDVKRDTSYSFLSQIDGKFVHTVDGKSSSKEFVLKQEPHVVPLPANMKLNGLNVNTSLKFQGHYNEPDAALTLKSVKNERKLYMLRYKIGDTMWTIEETKTNE